MLLAAKKSSTTLETSYENEREACDETPEVGKLQGSLLNWIISSTCLRKSLIKC